MVQVVVNSARTGSKSVKRPWFGAKLQVISSDLVEGLGLDRPAGALVSSVVAKGPAADAGLKSGDVIVKVDGQVIDDPDAFGFRYATKPLGGSVSLEVLRSGKRLTLPVKLTPAPETRSRDLVTLKGRWPLAGVTAGNMSPALAEEISVDASAEGVGIKPRAQQRYMAPARPKSGRVDTNTCTS